VDIQASEAEMTDGATQVEVAGGLLPAVTAASVVSQRGHLLTGCPFADRCPYVMDMCRESPPPLYRLDDSRAATCFLYRDRPSITSEALNEVMSAAGAAA
jgi:hypothetical protein